MSRSRIVIVGGGFAGVQCARCLIDKGAEGSIEIVLFNGENHLVFSPLLAEVVGSTLNPLDIIVPLRQLLPGVFCRTEVVRQVDLRSPAVEFVDEKGRVERLACEHLVLACGNVTNLGAVPGMADHGLPLKTVADAAEMRSHIMEEMEKAEVTRDEERRRWHLTFLVVGGGYSGVEAAGEINDLVRSSARYFRNWKAQDARVILIHSRDEILPEISPGLRAFARRKMGKMGETFELGARVALATQLGVKLEDGRFLSGGTIVSTVGSSPAEIVRKLDLPKQKDRLVTAPDLAVPGTRNTWAVGDCAWIINARDGQVCPTTGQFAERQGRQCADNILRVIQGKPTHPFTFKKLGELCSIGGHSAVADLFGCRLSGFFAWFLWRGIYLFKLPTLGRRVQVGFDRATLLVFPRDLAHIRTQRTDRVAHAHYSAGDFIFREGEAPTNFYVLEKGEVEVLRSTNGNGAEVVALLGAGSFFGEKALLTDRPRVMSIRARTPVEVLVLGKNVFEWISGALVPFKEALTKTLNRRATDIWQGREDVYALLQRTPVRELMEPFPRPLLKPDTTLREAGRAFVEHHHEFFFVSADGESLEGLVTITDLIRDRGVPLSGDTPVRDFMSGHPVQVSTEDNCAVALGVMRDYRLKTLPVVADTKVAGCLRIRSLIAFILRELAPVQSS